MSIVVHLCTARWDILETVLEVPKGVLHRYLPKWNESSFHLLCFIDWYGKTIFNRPQMRLFIPEWDRIAANAATMKEVAYFSQVRALAERYQQRPHFYLWFDGD